MKDEQKIRKEYKYSTSGVFKKKGSLWSPLWTWIPVPIVPKIDLYPSDFIIDHLILHHFSNNLISWPLLHWFLIYFFIFSYFSCFILSILSILSHPFHPFPSFPSFHILSILSSLFHPFRNPEPGTRSPERSDYPWNLGFTLMVFWAP